MAMGASAFSLHPLDLGAGKPGVRALLGRVRGEREQRLKHPGAGYGLLFGAGIDPQMDDLKVGSEHALAS